MKKKIRLKEREIFKIGDNKYNLNGLIIEGLINDIDGILIKQVLKYIRVEEEGLSLVKKLLKAGCSMPLNVELPPSSQSTSSLLRETKEATEKNREETFYTYLKFAKFIDKTMNFESLSSSRIILRKDCEEELDIKFVSERFKSLITQGKIPQNLTVALYKNQLECYSLEISEMLLNAINKAANEIDEFIEEEISKKDINFDKLEKLLSYANHQSYEILKKALEIGNNELIKLLVKSNIYIEEGDIKVEYLEEEKKKLIKSGIFADNIYSNPLAKSKVKLDYIDKELVEERLVNKLRLGLYKDKTLTDYKENEYTKGALDIVIKQIEPFIIQHIKNNNLLAVQYWHDSGYSLKLLSTDFVQEIFAVDTIEILKWYEKEYNISLNLNEYYNIALSTPNVVQFKCLNYVLDEEIEKQKKLGKDETAEPLSSFSYVLSYVYSPATRKKQTPEKQYKVNELKTFRDEKGDSLIELAISKGNSNLLKWLITTQTNTDKNYKIINFNLKNNASIFHCLVEFYHKFPDLYEKHEFEDWVYDFLKKYEVNTKEVADRKDDQGLSALDLAFDKEVPADLIASLINTNKASIKYNNIIFNALKHGKGKLLIEVAEKSQKLAGNLLSCYEEALILSIKIQQNEELIAYYNAHLSQKLSILHDKLQALALNEKNIKFLAALWFVFAKEENENLEILELAVRYDLLQNENDGEVFKLTLDIEKEGVINLVNKAVEFNSFESLKYLWKFFNVPDNYDTSQVLSNSIEKDNSTIITYLVNNNVKHKGHLEEAIFSKSTTVLKALLNNPEWNKLILPGEWNKSANFSLNNLEMLKILVEAWRGVSEEGFTKVINEKDWIVDYLNMNGSLNPPTIDFLVDIYKELPESIDYALRNAQKGIELVIKALEKYRYTKEKVTQIIGEHIIKSEIESQYLSKLYDIVNQSPTRERYNNKLIKEYDDIKPIGDGGVGFNGNFNGDDL